MRASVTLDGVIITQDQFKKLQEEFYKPDPLKPGDKFIASAGTNYRTNCMVIDPSTLQTVAQTVKDYPNYLLLLNLDTHKLTNGSPDWCERQSRIK